MTEEEVIYKKVGEWEEKGHRQQLKIKVENWLSQFEDEEKEEMLTLLLNFDYFSKNQISKNVVHLYNLFRQECKDTDIVFTKIDKEMSVGFSSVFYTCFWQSNNLCNYSADSIFKYNKANQLPQTIVIVDDFFGSGNTIIKFLSDLLSQNKNLINYKLYFLVMQGTEIGKINIETFAKDNNLNLRIVARKISAKAFAPDNIYSSLDVDFYKNKYSKICDDRNITLKFGYEEVEALVSFYYNSPNNTLGAFWCDVNNFKSLFPRSKKERTSLAEMRQKVKSNDYLEKQKPFISNADSYKNDIFMVYCLSKGTGFDLYEACYDFGLTEKQISDMIEYLCKEKFLQFSDSKYIATEKLKKYLFSTRIKTFNKLYRQTETDNIIELKTTSYTPKNFSDKFKGYKK